MFERGVWFGFAENLFFSEDDCHPTLYSFTNMAGHNGFLRTPGSSCFSE